MPTLFERTGMDRERVFVAPRFTRAIRLDTDLGAPEALNGFVCPPSFGRALEVMATQIRRNGHGAFTWTGPFGSGKSSLAVVLAALLSGSGTRQDRALALLGEDGARLLRMLRTGSAGYRTLGIVGRKLDGAALIAEGLQRERLVRKAVDPSKDGGASLLEALQRVSRHPKRAGLILLIDELGQILEAAVRGEGDLHFLQELAEVASRSEGRLLVIGILHQAFSEYSGRLATRIRDEWQKVQGRFVDLPLAPLAHEQLALLSTAIASDPTADAEFRARELARAIPDGHQGSQTDLVRHLTGCWPLNPVTACLLGPWSRRRFGQNQRSIFSFLSSTEPHGFQAFLDRALDAETYLPAEFWDYLRTNLEPTILASPDGHRWATATDALERCAQKMGGGGQNRIICGSRKPSRSSISFVNNPVLVPV